MRTDTEETGALLTAGTGGAVHFAVETGTSFESIGLSIIIHRTTRGVNRFY